jgi:hypothetical protein
MNLLGLGMLVILVNVSCISPALSPVEEASVELSDPIQLLDGSRWVLFAF